jgi:hypothetical protein
MDILYNNIGVWNWDSYLTNVSDHLIANEKKKTYNASQIKEILRWTWIIRLNKMWHDNFIVEKMRGSWMQQ